ncbi:MAG: TolC family protein [Treponema sp.]|nr:TolC family protein [Treponema sp.]
MFKKFLILSVLAFFSAFVFAQGLSENAGPEEKNVKSLRLEDALNLAIKNNVSVKRERILLDAAKRASSHSWNSVLPSFFVSANDELEMPDIAGGSGKNNAGFQNNFGLEGKISIGISSDFFASMQKTKLDYEAKRISFEEAISEIAGQVKEFYFSLLLAKENIDFLKENLESAKNQALQNEERYRKGILSEMEYLSSKVSYEKLKPELKSKELAYKKTTKDFYLYIGLEEDVQLQGSLEEFVKAYKDFFNAEMKTRLAENVNAGEIPSVKNIEKQIEAAKKNVAATRLSYYGPRANLSYAVNPLLAGGDKGRIKQFASIGISIPVENILPFSKGADSIRAAEDSVNVLQLRFAEKNKKVRQEFSYIIQSLNQKDESIDSFKSFVSLAQANYDTTKFAYSKGMTEFLSLQNALKENFEAKLNLQKDFLETLKLYLSLEKLCGISAISPVEE